MKHRETHPVDVPGCFGCRVLGVQINTSSAGAATVNERERNWDRDMPAYKALRKQGLQPKGIDGCAELATRANSQMEIEMGHIVPKQMIPRIKEGMAEAKELGWSPVQS